MITGDADFTAILKYLTPEEGGRTNPVVLNYFPLIKFPFSEIMTGGKQKFLNKQEVYPGETVEAEIELLNSDIFLKQLSEGMEFKFEEIPRRTLGTGVIRQIINLDLKKP